MTPYPESPLPWRGTDNSILILDEKGFSVGRIITPEDLSYIVHAANAYPKLVGFLEDIVYASSRKAGFEEDMAQDFADLGKDARALLEELGETNTPPHET